MRVVARGKAGIGGGVIATKILAVLQAIQALGWAGEVPAACLEFGPFGFCFPGCAGQPHGRPRALMSNLL